MSERTCGNCRFYNPNTNDDRNGECRAHPPVVIPAPSMADPMDAVWPWVRSADWCGEWVAAKPSRRVPPPIPAARGRLP